MSLTKQELERRANELGMSVSQYLAAIEAERRDQEEFEFWKSVEDGSYFDDEKREAV